MFGQKKKKTGRKGWGSDANDWVLVFKVINLYFTYIMLWKTITKYGYCLTLLDGGEHLLEIYDKMLVTFKIDVHMQYKCYNFAKAEKIIGKARQVTTLHLPLPIII